MLPNTLQLSVNQTFNTSIPPARGIEETALETGMDLNDEFDAMSDFGIHLEFDINDIEESEADEISWQDLCEILCD